MELQLTSQTSPTLSSMEIVGFINELRLPGDAELRHDNFMAKLEKHPGIASPKFLGDVEVGIGNGATRKSKCYYLPKREANLMVMSESLEVQTRVYDRMVALELALAQTSLPLSQKNQQTTMTSIDFARVARIGGVESQLAYEFCSVTRRIEALIRMKDMKIPRDEVSLLAYDNSPKPDNAPLVRVDYAGKNAVVYYLNQEAVFTLAAEYLPGQRNRIIKRWLELNSTYTLPEEIQEESDFVEQAYAKFASQGLSKAKATPLVLAASAARAAKAKAASDQIRLTQANLKLENKRACLELKLELKKEKAIQTLAADRLFRTDEEEAAFINNARAESVKAPTVFISNH